MYSGSIGDRYYLLGLSLYEINGDTTPGIAGSSTYYELNEESDIDVDMVAKMYKGSDWDAHLLAKQLVKTHGTKK